MLTLRPALLGTLITTNVDKLRGEELDNLIEHLLEELVCCLLTCAKHLGCYAPCCPYVYGLLVATQPWERVECSLRVTRHLNLGDNLDIALGSICYNLANLLLSVVATIRYAIPLHGVEAVADKCLLTHRALLSELGVCLDLDTPALVIGEVPV